MIKSNNNAFLVQNLLHRTNNGLSVSRRNVYTSPKAESSEELESMIDTAANRTLKIIRKVRLQHPHPASSVIRNHLSRQSARVSPVDLQYVVRAGAIGEIPPVNVALALLAEKHGCSVIRTEEHDLVPFGSHVSYSPVGRAVPKVTRLDGEEILAAEVGEDETAATVRSTDQREIENVSTSATVGHCLRQDHSVASAGGHVEDQDSSTGSVGHVDEDTTVAAVIRYDVLQARRVTCERTYVHGFHHLEYKSKCFPTSFAFRG